jgi:hypothetical protein
MTIYNAGPSFTLEGIMQHKYQTMTKEEFARQSSEDRRRILDELMCLAFPEWRHQQQRKVSKTLGVQVEWEVN